jgi:gluconate 2-dehydrogenase gamma chain
MADTRRAFLHSAIAASAAGSLVGCSPSGATVPWRFFTLAEARNLDAVCEQLIPADRDPGAKAAGVVHYIDIQLTRAFRKHRQTYRQGLAQIDSLSRAKFAGAFADLSSAQQTEILHAAGKSAQPFFELVLAHTRQGFYGDPRHGGNRNRASWKMVGLDNPPLRGRQHYEGV